MSDTETVTTTFQAVRKRRVARPPVSPTAILEQPFVRMTRNGVQITLTRDALAALGRPSHIVWHYDDKSGFIRLGAATAEKPDAYTISYSKSRPSAVASVPSNFRGLLQPGKYMVVSWGKGDGSGSGENWIQFGTITKIMNLEAKEGEKKP